MGKKFANLILVKLPDHTSLFSSLSTNHVYFAFIFFLLSIFKCRLYFQFHTVVGYCLKINEQLSYNSVKVCDSPQ